MLTLERNFSVVFALAADFSPETSRTMTTSNKNIADGITFQFIKDDFAKLCEQVQEREFLYSGKVPVAGMRTETQIEVSQVGWARFSGIITAIHDPPTQQELETICKPFECLCNDSECLVKNGIAAAFGAEHGQRITGRGILNFDFYDKMKDNINKDQVYEIEYQLDSNKNYVWCVIDASSINDVSGDGFRNLIWSNKCDCKNDQKYKKII